MSSYFLLHGQRFSLSAISSETGLVLPKHNQNETQLFYLQKGLVTVEDERGYCTISPGQIAWIPPYINFKIEILGRIVGWGASLAPQLCMGMPEMPCALECSDFIPLILARAISWRQEDNAGVYQSLLARHERMLQIFLDELRFGSQVQDRLLLPKSRRLNYMAQEILKHPVERISIHDWAVKIGMSTRSISRNFSNETNLTFVQWRQGANLLNARKKLALGSDVKDVATAVGYENVSAFIASFKKVFGQTPVQFRQLFD